MIMADVEPGVPRSGPGPDLYQLMGVPRRASQEEIVQAWRRRARAEHPDSRPDDAAAPDRFRVLAEAYQVLSDPSRRAAYDRTLGAAPVRPGVVTSGAATPVVRARPPLWVGPVRVEGPRRAPAAGGRDEEEARLAVLAWWYLTGERPW
jgi:curved DNA-binding protein CbpA